MIYIFVESYRIAVGFDGLGSFRKRKAGRFVEVAEKSVRAADSVYFGYENALAIGQKHGIDERAAYYVYAVRRVFFKLGHELFAAADGYSVVAVGQRGG